MPPIKRHRGLHHRGSARRWGAGAKSDAWPWGPAAAGLLAVAESAEFGVAESAITISAGQSAAMRPGLSIGVQEGGRNAEGAQAPAGSFKSLI